MKNFTINIYQGTKIFGEDIAALINSILLSSVYILGVGLTSITAKLFRKGFLDLKTDKNAKTYWQTLDLKKRPMEEYYRQF